MKTLTIVLLVMTGLVWVSVFMLAGILILLRMGKVPLDFFGTLDEAGIAKLSRRSLWTFIPLALILGCGILMFFFNFNPPVFGRVLGALAVSVAAAGSIAVLVIRETARRAQNKRER